MDDKTTFKKAVPAVTAADEALLTKDEIEAARRVAGEEVKAEHKKRAKNKLIEKFKQEAEAALNPEEATRPITLDLADHQPNLMVDGVIYWHGQTYNVKKGLYETLVEMQSRGWDHDET
ncbi:MAG: hypothetical protein KGI52_18515, partial [Burkholderiales bacterium]|nr:hypothetical protein [Burkholderiales bacterium]